MNDEIYKKISSSGMWRRIVWYKFIDCSMQLHMILVSCFFFFLIGLIFDPEDGDSTFLQNVCKIV
jgi:hypothetical protein